MNECVSLSRTESVHECVSGHVCAMAGGGGVDVVINRFVICSSLFKGHGLS